MNSRIKFSGDIYRDILHINGLDELDYALFNSEYLIYSPANSNKLKQFLETHKRIVFCADSDVDGLSSAGVVKSYFKDALIEFGERNGDRGLTPDIYEIIKAFYVPDGIVTLDCGITNFTGIASAIADGVAVFVTDHHKPENVLPPCDIINPWLENLYFSDYCGAGVIYSAMSSIYGENEKALQYAAIGTICDVVMLAQDNRYIVSSGLKLINSNPVKPIANTLKALNINGTVTEKKIGWYFGPAVNAASRLDSTRTAINALLYDDYESSLMLRELNNRRKNLTKTSIETAEIQEYDDVIIAFINDGLIGITGLISMRLASTYGKAACVFIKDGNNYRASLRTMDLWNAAEFVQITTSVKGGGHFGSAGFSCSKDKIDNIIESIKDFAHKQSINRLDSSVFQADIDISIAEAVRNYPVVASLAPYGRGFKAPVFKSTVIVDKTLCKTTTGGHISMILDGIQAYYYNPQEQLYLEGLFDIAYELEYNEWKKSPQLIILKMEKL